MHIYVNLTKYVQDKLNTHEYKTQDKVYVWYPTCSVATVVTMTSSHFGTSVTSFEFQLVSSFL